MIEKGIALPARRKDNALRDLVVQMEPGDSILFESETQAAAAKRYGYCKGYKMTSRKIDREGWRVWRIR